MRSGRSLDKVLMAVQFSVPSFPLKHMLIS